MDTLATARTLLGQTRAGAQAITFLHGMCVDADLHPRHRLRIALYLGQRGLSAYSLAELRCSGRAAGLSEEEMQANLSGDSADPQGSACLHLVTAILAGRAPSASQLESMRLAGFSASAILAITALTETHQLLARLCRFVSLAVTPRSDGAGFASSSCASACETRHDPLFAF